MPERFFADGFGIVPGNERPFIRPEGKAHKALLFQNILQRFPLGPPLQKGLIRRFFRILQQPHFIQ